MNQIISLIFDDLGLILISSGFMFFGIFFYLFDLMYKGSSIVQSGEIVGIEKYISRTRVNNTRTSSLMYRPVVKFILNSKEQYFTGSVGKNVITDKIGEQVKVEYIKDIPSTVRIAGRNYMRNISYILFIICFIIMAVTFTTSDEDFVVKAIRAVMPLFINYIAYTVIKNKISKLGGLRSLMKQKNVLKSKSDLEDLDIFWNNDQIANEQDRVHRPFLFITPVLIGLCSWPAYIFTEKFFNRPYVQENFNNALQNLDSAKVFLNYVMSRSHLQKDFILMTGSSFFVVILIYSFIFTLKKTK